MAVSEMKKTIICGKAYKNFLFMFHLHTILFNVERTHNIPTYYNTFAIQCGMYMHNMYIYV